MKIEIVDSEPGFAALRDEWNDLLASSSSDSLFLTWEWLHTWWKHFNRNRRLFIVTVRSESQLVAIAPLVSTRGWVTRLEFAGLGTIGSDYLDVIVRRGFENQALAHLARVLTTTVRLPRVRESSGLAQSLAAMLTANEWKSVKVPTEVCPYIDLGSRTFDEYLAGLGSSHRYNFKRRLRNLTKQYDMKIQYAQTDDERRDALRHVIGLHLQRWSERGGSDAFNADEVLAFHEEFSALAQKRGWLRLLVITLDGQAAAAFYGFRYGEKFSFYQSGFDPAFVKSSVGLVMIGLTIRDAIAEGAAEYDFLHGDESYKFLWTRTVHQLVRLDLYPPGRLGRLHRDAARVKSGVRSLVRHFSSAGRKLTNQTPGPLHQQ